MIHILQNGFGVFVRNGSKALIVPHKERIALDFYKKKCAKKS